MQTEMRDLKNQVLFSKKVNSIQTNAQGLTVPKEIESCYTYPGGKKRRVFIIFHHLELGVVPDEKDYFKIIVPWHRRTRIYENGRIKWKE